MENRAALWLWVALGVSLGGVCSFSVVAGVMALFLTKILNVFDSDDAAMVRYGRVALKFTGGLMIFGQICGREVARTGMVFWSSLIFALVVILWSRLGSPCDILIMLVDFDYVWHRLLLKMIGLAIFWSDPWSVRNFALADDIWQLMYFLIGRWRYGKGGFLIWKNLVFGVMAWLEPWFGRIDSTLSLSFGWPMVACFASTLVSRTVNVFVELLYRPFMTVSPMEALLIYLVVTAGSDATLPTFYSNCEHIAILDCDFVGRRDSKCEWVGLASWWFISSTQYSPVRSLFLFIPMSSEGNEDGDRSKKFITLFKLLNSLATVVVAKAKLDRHGFEKIYSSQNITCISDAEVGWKAITSRGFSIFWKLISTFEDLKKLLLRSLFGILSSSVASPTRFVFGFLLSLIYLLFGRLFVLVLLLPLHYHVVPPSGVG